MPTLPSLVLVLTLGITLRLVLRIFFNALKDDSPLLIVNTGLNGRCWANLSYSSDIMDSSQKVLLFGDAHVEMLSAVQRLFALARIRPQLRLFLRAACDVVQCQISALLPEERAVFGEFNDLLELAERHTFQEQPDEIIGYVLLTTVQIGDLLHVAEQDASILGRLGDSVHPLGLCVGLLAASVAFAARDTCDIERLGLEVVGISLRLGVAVRRRSRYIETSDDSWACTFFGLEIDVLQKKLEAFNQTFLKARSAYIGAIAQPWTTVFAPPSTLKKFCLSVDAPQKVLSSAAAVHAPHLTPVDIQGIIGDSPVLDLGIPSSSCFMSTSSSAPYKATILRSLLQQVVEDITYNPLWVERTIENLAITIGNRAEVTLISLGPNRHTSMTQKILMSHALTVYLDNKKTHIEALGDARGGSHDIAIVGMSGRFPGSEDVNEFWETLQAGKSLHQEIPSSRFDIDDFYDPSGDKPNSIQTRFGVFLKNPGLFDNRFFNISPNEALQMDPLQRMLLMCTYEALENAGYVQNATNSSHSSRTGIYFGQTVDDWKDINVQRGIDTHYLPSLDRAFHPGRIAHFFKLGGGFYSVDTACSSSLTCIHLACKALIDREQDMSIVAGGSLLGAPEMFSGLSKGGFLSPTGGCKTFQNDADGYCRGEAVGVIILKRLEDAVRENDNILAVIRGTARNSNAGAASITYPGQDAQEKLFRTLLRQSATNPDDVGLIEMHGTGTQASDSVEITAVRNVFAKTRSRDNPLHVAAVKAVIGHSEAAAGIVSLIKSILVLRNGTIPPQPGLPFEVNHKFSKLEDYGMIIANGKHKLSSRLESDGKRRIVVNSFDAAGGNTSMIIEDAPLRQFRGKDPRTHHLIAVSSFCLSSQAANKRKLVQYLAENPNLFLSDLAYTTTARRQHALYRDCYVSTSVDDLVKQLDANNGPEVPPPSTASPVVFLFTGQSSQYSGMGKALYETSRSFRQTIDECQTLCDTSGLASFVGLIRGTEDTKGASAAQIQLAIVVLEYALARYWQSLGVKPCLVMGHSLGEYPALCVSGVLSINDALLLVHKRATLMEQRCGQKGSTVMLSTPISKDGAQRFLKSQTSCDISCLNGPSSTVLSGPTDEIRAIRAELKDMNFESVLLSTHFGFHSRAMDPMLDEFEAFADQVIYSSPGIPIASTLTGTVVKSDGVINAKYLRRQIREPVAFMNAVKACEADGMFSSGDMVLEIGPHPVCIDLVAQTIPDAQLAYIPSLHRRKGNWETISEVLACAYIAKVPILWHEYHRDYVDCLRLLHLPSYAFELKDYWASYKTQLPTVPLREVDRGFVSPSLQKIESLNVEGSNVSALFTSRVSEPALYNAIHGHVVDDVAICPASIFADMAFSAAKVILREASIPIELSGMEIVDLSMTHALVVHSDDTKQIVHIAASFDKLEGSMLVSFSSTDDTIHMAEHGKCRIILNDPPTSKRSDWSRTEHLFRARIKCLTDSRKTNYMTQPLIYKLFASLVDYDRPYHTLTEIHVDGKFEEAVATINITEDQELGTFIQNPYVLDALVHLPGFLLNTNPSKPNADLYIAGHIGSMCILEKLTKDRKYTAYATIRDGGGKCTFLGDVYVFDQQELVAMCTDIKFQRLSREIFGMMVGKDDLGGYQNIRPKRPLSIDEDSFSPDNPSGEYTICTPASSTHKSDEAPYLAAVFLNAVALKTGVNLLEIHGDTYFSDLGIDSQMSISILTAFKRQTGVELPAAFFSEFTTVKSVQEELGDMAGALEVSPPVKPIIQGTPRVSKSVKPRNSTPTPSTQRNTKLSGNFKQIDMLLKIIANSLGLDVSELTPSTEFAAIGVDSILSIKILSDFRKQSGIELPAAFFNDNPSVSGVYIQLDGSLARTNNVNLPPSAPVTQASLESLLIENQQQVQIPESRVILIQGKSHSNETPLFLATDGSGAVTPYIHLPALPNGRKVYALESPFLQMPDHYSLTIQEMADVFIAAIRKVQPHGPYLVGGWSAGGIYAYEISRRLAMEGERINGLVMMDTRVNHSVPGAQVTMEFIERFGIFTGVGRGNLLSGLSDIQKGHLTSTVRALCKYDLQPFPEGRGPRKTHIIWAAKGLNDSPNHEEHDDKITWPAAMKPASSGKSIAEMTMEDFELEFKSWFFAKRQDFGTNGWEEYLGDEIAVHKVEADHFSMVVPPNVRQLGSILLEIVKDFASIEAEEQLGITQKAGVTFAQAICGAERKLIT